MVHYGHGLLASVLLTGVPLDFHRAYALTPSRHRDEDAVFCVAPAATATHLAAEALAAAQEACVRAGWKVVLAEKPLHGLQDEEPKTIKNARAAIEAWVCLQVAATEDFED